MDLKRVLRQLEEADGQIDRYIELVFISIAAAFGAWVTWTVAGATDVGVLGRIGVAICGALVCAAAMWVFWFFARFLG